VVFGRHQRGRHLDIADLSTRLQPGDLITVVGPAQELDEVTAGLGEVSQEPLARCCWARCPFRCPAAWT
jgi:putative transport protein